jgi:hypothetical protein
MKPISEAAKILQSLNEMSRGVVVLDENLEALAGPLWEKGIKTITPRKGTKDKEIKRDLLPHRILITNNTKDFIDDAVAYEYGIIATEGLRSKDAEITADIVSRAVTKYSLWALKQGFVLYLKPDGKHKLEILNR